MRNQFKPNGSSAYVFLAELPEPAPRGARHAAVPVQRKQLVQVVLLWGQQEGEQGRSFQQQPSVRWWHGSTQQGLSPSREGLASKGLLQTQLGARLKCLSVCRFVNSHVAVATTDHKTSFPLSDFSSFMFAFGENSKGFLKEMFCHRCYRIW